MNALKHGCDAAPENDAEVMRALGEDPQQYEALKEELATAYGPGDALWDHQLDDLGRLYWRRNRLERMETGGMREALEEVEDERRSLARGLASVTFDPSQCDAVTLDQPQPGHFLVQLRMLISLWGVIREQVRRRVFPHEQRFRVEGYYEEQVGWRSRQIGHLLRLFTDWAYYQQKQDQEGLNQYVKDKFGGEGGVEARYQELVRLLEEEIGMVEAAFAEEMAAQERKYAIERDSCLAPQDETADKVLRLGAGLDRAIDRKVRILLAMRKEHASVSKGGSRTSHTGTPWRAPTQEASPPDHESNDREAEELSKLVGLDGARESGAGVPPAVAGASRSRRQAEPVLSAAKECPHHSGQHRLRAH
jgi:hypothetical protein